MWRRLKTGTSHRVVPLFPQLEKILRDYLLAREREAPLGSLLFPSARLESEGMIRDSRKALDHVSVRAGWQKGEVRTKAFRHSFCAAALQLLDRGHPISPWTVARWMGHGGQSLVDQVYGPWRRIRILPRCLGCDRDPVGVRRRRGNTWCWRRGVAVFRRHHLDTRTPG